MKYETIKNITFVIFDLGIAILGVIVTTNVTEFNFWDALFLMIATLLFGLGMFNLISHIAMWLKVHKLKKLLRKDVENAH